jgi:hypothetical protein
MIEESAKKASLILKRKSELNEDLSKLMNLRDLNIFVEEKTEECYLYYGYGDKQHLSKDLKDKIVNLLLEEINKELQELDGQLKMLNC